MQKAVVNLTPHLVRLIMDGWVEEFPQSGTVARIVAERTVSSAINGWPCVEAHVGVPVLGVKVLPDTAYIVETDVAMAMARHKIGLPKGALVVSPNADRTVCDATGADVGFEGFVVWK